MSSALTCFGSASPRQRMRNRAAAFSPFADLGLGDRRLLPARCLRDDRQGRARELREIVARLLVGDVDDLLHPPLRAERRERGLEVGGHGPARILELDPVDRLQRRVDVLVDEQPPDVLERVAADELLDVDAAIAERAAVLVRLGDLRLERDHAFEPRAEFWGAHSLRRRPSRHLRSLLNSVKPAFISARSVQNTRRVRPRSGPDPSRHSLPSVEEALAGLPVAEALGRSDEVGNRQQEEQHRVEIEPLSSRTHLPF